MSSCEILKDKKVQFGHKVSHSKVKTNKKFRVNTHKITLYSDILGQSFRFNIAVSTLRSVNLYGFDHFLTKTLNFKLTDEALRIKKNILKKTTSENSGMTSQVV